MTPTFNMSENDIKEAIKEYFAKRGLGKVNYVYLNRTECDGYMRGSYEYSASVTLEELKISS